MTRFVVALNLTRRIPQDLVFAQSVANAMKGNAYFPSPEPSIATLEADIAALAAAEPEALTRGKGAREARDARYVVVRDDLQSLRIYVQIIANQVPNEGPAIIESAGMFVKRVGHFMKPILEARMGLPSGVVLLIALAQGDRVAYKWQYSLDQTTWVDLPDTLQAKTTVSGLPENTMVFFRLQCLTKDGLGDFSDVVAFFVR
jgi:hypothetical protein